MKATAFVLAIASVWSSGAIAQRHAADNAVLITRHYPATSLARGEEGTVGFRVDLDRAGKITRCAVTRTSGYAALDTATCDLMIENARFDATAAADGRHRPSSHDGVLRWTLPRGTVRPATAPPRDVATRTDDVVCRRAPRMGSLYVTEKVCLTPADWDRTVLYARSQLSYYQGADFRP